MKRVQYRAGRSTDFEVVLSSVFLLTLVLTLAGLVVL